VSTVSRSPRAAGQVNQARLVVPMAWTPGTARPAGRADRTPLSRAALRHETPRPCPSVKRWRARRDGRMGLLDAGAGRRGRGAHVGTHRPHAAGGGGASASQRRDHTPRRKSHRQDVTLAAHRARGRGRWGHATLYPGLKVARARTVGLNEWQEARDGQARCGAVIAIDRPSGWGRARWPVPSPGRGTATSIPA
jgi:hypothetical protein